MMRFNHTLISSNVSYTYTELSELLNVSKTTLRNWRGSGLKVLEPNSSPILFLGSEVKRFLLEKKSQRKIKLNPGEFFCTRCHASRKSKPEKILIEKSNKKLGDTFFAKIIGECIICGNKLIFFSSERKLPVHLNILTENKDSTDKLQIGGIE